MVIIKASEECINNNTVNRKIEQYLSNMIMNEVRLEIILFALYVLAELGRR